LFFFAAVGLRSWSAVARPYRVQQRVDVIVTIGTSKPIVKPRKAVGAAFYLKPPINTRAAVSIRRRRTVRARHRSALPARPRSLSAADDACLQMLGDESDEGVYGLNLLALAIVALWVVTPLDG
jgi:hypothetical protein